MSLPPDTIAYRMGDLVFTYHGIDLMQPDPRLWVVIMVPDQGINGAMISVPSQSTGP